MNQIKQGLDQCVSQYPDWPPTIGQFMRLCEVDAADYGLPDASDAWSQICIEGQRYSHGVVLAVRSDPRCDVFNWRLLPMEKGLKKFAPIYREYVNRAIGGEVFDLPIQIEDKRREALTPEEKKKAAATYFPEIKKALAGGCYEN